jgi:hypothetical protein
LSAPPRSTARCGPARWVLAGCGLLAVCGLAAGALAAGWWWLGTRAPAGQPTVEYVVDASARMALQAEASADSRLAVAGSVLAEVVRPANPAVTAGLRVFGAGQAADPCQDSELLVPLAAANQAAIAGRLTALEAGARPASPLAAAMVQAVRDVSTTRGPHTLVVVTGGADSCQPEAGALIASEAERAGIDLEYFVIGFQVLPSEAEALRLLAEALPGAHFLPARDRDQLKAILDAIQARIDEPSSHSLPDVLATAQAGSTAAPTPAILVTDTPAPGQLTPDATSAGNVTPEATEVGGYQSQSACDHPYFPLRESATWTYARSFGGPLGVTVTSVAGDLDSAEATLANSLEGLSDVITVACDPDGLRAVSSSSGSDIGLGLVSEFGPRSSQVEATGVWLLPAEMLVPGASWSLHNVYVLPQGRTMTVDQEFTVTGTEPILVASQTVEALRVDSTYAYEVRLDTTGTITDYFVRGIGLVRREATITTSGVTASNTLELQTYTVP